MTKRLILIAGNIGAGKTTLAERLADKLGWQAAYESVSDNPFLGDFYNDMQRWAFHLQIFFLGDRADQQRRMAQLEKSAIIDRSIYEDYHVFAKAALRLGNVTEREFDAYGRVFDMIVQGLPKPDLLLYLDARVETLVDRIHGRGRDIESGIQADYLELLDSFYGEWVDTFDDCPVLTIPADDLNFVNNERHLDIIVEKIDEKLSGKEKVVFPDNL